MTNEIEIPKCLTGFVLIPCFFLLFFFICRPKICFGIVTVIAKCGKLLSEICPKREKVYEY